MNPAAANIRQQLSDLVHDKYGQCDELLMESGVLDSLKAVELAIEVGTIFDIETKQLKLNDMATLTSLTQAILSIQNQKQTQRSGREI